MTLTVDEQGPRSRRWAQALVPPLLAMIVSWLLIAYRSPYRGLALLTPSSYDRWDSGQYLGIARYGYYATWTCPPNTLPAVLPPGRYLCGRMGWFPGYPFTIRGVSALTDLAPKTAGLVIAWVCWYLLLALMWRLLAGARSTTTRWMCLLIAAFFPGCIYFAAIFPVSMCIAGILGCLYCALRTSRRGLAWVGLVVGFVAAYSYITAIVLAPALLIVGVLVTRGRRRFHMIVAAIGVGAGFLAVLATMQVTVGIWNAYFLSAEKYEVGAHQPLATLITRLYPLWASPQAGPVKIVKAQQTLLTLCFLVLVCLVTIIVAVRGQRRSGELTETELTETELTKTEPQRWTPHWPQRWAARWQLGWPATWSEAITSRVSVFDLTLLLTAIGVWLVPYIAGGQASTYRSEAFVVVGVPLLRRLPPWLLVVPLVATVWVAWHIVPDFFNSQLE